MRNLHHARRSSPLPQGQVEIEDSEGTVLMFGDEVDEAFERLRDVDWPEHRGGRLIWDHEAREWFDPSRRYGF